MLNAKYPKPRTCAICTPFSFLPEVYPENIGMPSGAAVANHCIPAGRGKIGFSARPVDAVVNRIGFWA